MLCSMYSWVCFTATSLWINGVSNTTIPNTAEIATVFDCVRIQKVEVTIMSGNDSLDYANQTLSSGTRSIPYLYEAFDPNDSTNPTLGSMQELVNAYAYVKQGY